jgi:hypothetical protein
MQGFLELRLRHRPRGHHPVHHHILEHIPPFAVESIAVGAGIVDAAPRRPWPVPLRIGV